MPISDKPKLFIGTSKESMYLANTIESLIGSEVYCTKWTDAFPLSYNTVDSLLKQLNKHDFALFLLSPDDIIKMRNTEYSTARDNLFYEAGLATGIYGKLRCFLVIPKDFPDFHLPSDLSGLTVGVYEHKNSKTDPAKSLASCSEEIKKAIKENLWSTIKIEITTHCNYSADPKISYKSKIFFYLTNEEKYAVTVELGRCNLNRFTIDNLHKTYGGKKYYQPSFHTDKIDGKDIFNEKYTFQTHQQKSGWIPLDPAIPEAEIKKFLKQNETGSIIINCSIDSDHPISLTKNILI